MVRLVDLKYTKMVKLLLLLAFACFQFSNQEESSAFENPAHILINDEIPPLAKDEILDGADEDQWYKGENQETVEDDEKWFQGIQEPLKESDEDYGELDKLIEDIEKWIQEFNPEKSGYEWLYDIEKWLDGDEDDWSEYPDYEKEKETLGLVADKNNYVDVYYSGLYQAMLKNPKNKERQAYKRFSSV